MKNLVVLNLLLILFFYNGVSDAQWVQMNGPYDGDVSCLGFSGTNIFAGLESMSLNVSGVYLSLNSGTNWIHVNNGLPGYLFVYSIAIIDTNIFAGTEGGVYLSTNMGTNWTEVNNGMIVSYTYSLAVSGNNIFAGTYNGMFISTNNGTNWTQINNGLPDICLVYSIAISDTNIFAGAWSGGPGSGGIYLSTNNGTNWTKTNNNLTITYTQSLVFSGTNIFAGTDNGVYLSTNNGKNWTQENNGLTTANVTSLAVSGNNIIAGTYGGGVFLSKDNGTNWTPVGLPNAYVLSLVVNGTNLFAGTKVTGVWMRPLSEFTGVSNEVNDLPKEFTLSQNYPNPFNPGTVISYSLPSASNVKLIVYNTLGQTTKILENAYKQAGNYSINFNASALPSGVYFYKLEAGQFSQIKKMILIK
jgi:photosystem II stability/assembly factor-like uncharacterized protein